MCRSKTDLSVLVKDSKSRDKASKKGMRKNADKWKSNLPVWWRIYFFGFRVWRQLPQVLSLMLGKPGRVEKYPLDSVTWVALRDVVGVVSEEVRMESVRG